MFLYKLYLFIFNPTVQRKYDYEYDCFSIKLIYTLITKGIANCLRNVFEDINYICLVRGNKASVHVY